MNTVAKLFNGRQIKEEKVFNFPGTFKSMWAAEGWLKHAGYSWGSTTKDRKTGKDLPVALVKGEYDLPQKWHNFDKVHKAMCDGVMTSNDFREGIVKVIIFEPKIIL